MTEWTSIAPPHDPDRQAPHDHLRSADTKGKWTTQRPRKPYHSDARTLTGSTRSGQWTATGTNCGEISHIRSTKWHIASTNENTFAGGQQVAIDRL